MDFTFSPHDIISTTGSVICKVLIYLIEYEPDFRFLDLQKQNSDTKMVLNCKLALEILS